MKPYMSKVSEFMKSIHPDDKAEYKTRFQQDILPTASMMMMLKKQKQKIPFKKDK